MFGQSGAGRNVNERLASHFQEDKNSSITTNCCLMSDQ